MRIENGHIGQDLHSQFSILNLQRCIELARIPGAAVEPNPRVGAVVVHEGRIIGEGAHEFFGGPHAEVNAIASVRFPELLPESTLYVSLEPCNHHGKTPPCTQLILEKGIRHVVVGSVDPNPQMSGKSIAFLREKGVTVDVLENPEAFIALNRHFWTNQQHNRPYVVLKWAETLDHKIAGMGPNGLPEPRAISNMLVNRRFHRLRHELQAICIGKHTALIDNPSLTTRHWPGRNPVKIVLDQNLSLPASLRLFQDGIVVVVNSQIEAVKGNVRYWKWQEPRDLAGMLTHLYTDLKIGSILVEGGQNTTQQFLGAGLWDEIYQCISKKSFGDGVAAPRIPAQLSPNDEWNVGGDTIRHYFR